MIKVYAPASIGNVGVGFDVLGAAISPVDGSLLGDTVTVSEADVYSLSLIGRFVKKLPSKNEENIAYQGWRLFCRAIGRDVPVAMTLEKNMPIGSGLGSSACSVVATLVAMNDFCGRPLTSNQLLLLMGELEGTVSGSIHYDNVAPCYLGGLQLLVQEQDMITQPLPSFESWYWVMAYPGIKVPTAEARAILPSHYQKAEIIEHGRLLAGFVHASHTQQGALAAKLMKDIVAEPYRKQLLPRFTEARQASLGKGALACSISGSGPTLFAICDDWQVAQSVSGWLQQHYLQNKEGFVHICRLDTAGARQLG